ncbi:RED-like protein N-terminal region-domain-containing protein [Lentinula aciculospora]|uniref:RED-like protein N-terminal region-domain-containing protein n=1 Tax=Lentinula aciculospora TaxID=153920 RepID=A0A9W9A5Q6_9AGAR|nr:RED-like protein N-terminal region-domain-containing protein [Lentinula aciculospora]
MSVQSSGDWWQTARHRKLTLQQLLSSGSSQTRTQPRESLFTKKNSSKASAKPTAISSSEPAFKPRKVKKLEGRYRDRAAERRVGEGNDYAQVEAVLEEFEKRTTDQDQHAIDEQRRYLGGDSEHSVLVKGLDMALLQQNKAKVAMATDEDESLEQAYITSSSEPIPNPKKRTREEIIQELKEKRAQGSGSAPAENLSKSKFKPIGFNPIGGPGEQKEKKKKIKGDGERKKKKRKVKASTVDNTKEMMAVEPTPSTSIALPPPPKLPEPEKSESLEEFDIFAGIGEYQGLDDDDNDDEAEGEDEKKEKREVVIPSTLHPGRWFTTDEQMEESPDVADNESPVPISGPSGSHRPPIEEGEASDEEQPMRLVPLSSSAVPSIKELLAIDEAAEAADKKHKRKNKKKNGEGTSSKKLDAEAKVNRDYQRLKSYTDKLGDE